MQIRLTGPRGKEGQVFLGMSANVDIDGVDSFKKGMPVKSAEIVVSPNKIATMRIECYIPKGGGRIALDENFEPVVKTMEFAITSMDVAGEEIIDVGAEESSSGEPGEAHPSESSMSTSFSCESVPSSSISSTSDPEFFPYELYEDGGERQEQTAIDDTKLALMDAKQQLKQTFTDPDMTFSSAHPINWWSPVGGGINWPIRQDITVLGPDPQPHSSGLPSDMIENFARLRDEAVNRKYTKTDPSLQ